MFVPINVVHEHWYLGVIFPQRRLIAVVDSFGAGSERAFDLLLRYVQDEHQDKHQTPLPHVDAWKRLSMQSPRQRNWCDCGAFVLFNVDLLALGQALGYTQEDIPLFRRHVVLACLNGSL